MEDPPKPPPLDYQTPPPQKHDPFRIMVYTILGTIIALAIAFATAIFLMPTPPMGGSGH